MTSSLLAGQEASERSSETRATRGGASGPAIMSALLLAWHQWVAGPDSADGAAPVRSP